MSDVIWISESSQALLTLKIVIPDKSGSGENRMLFFENLISRNTWDSNSESRIQNPGSHAMPNPINSLNFDKSPDIWRPWIQKTLDFWSLISSHCSKWPWAGKQLSETKNRVFLMISPVQNVWFWSWSASKVRHLFLNYSSSKSFKFVTFSVFFQFRTLDIPALFPLEKVPSAPFLSSESFQMPLFTPLLLISCLGLLFASSDVQQLECPLSDLLFAVAVCNPRTAKLREFVMQWPNTKLNTLPRDIRREIVDLCDDVVVSWGPRDSEGFRTMLLTYFGSFEANFQPIFSQFPANFEVILIFAGMPIQSELPNDARTRSRIQEDL